MSKKVVEDLSVRGTLDVAAGSNFEDITVDNVTVDGNTIDTDSGTLILQAVGGTGVVQVNSGVVLDSTVASITASTTQTQGEGPLTGIINEVSTVANTDDTVTLPAAAAGRHCVVINNGANQLQIFPASGDDAGGGVDTAVSLASGSNVHYIAYDATTWETFSSSGISDVVSDTTPQLGGALDVNSQQIVSVSSGDIELHSDNDVNIILGDASGVDDLNIKDSGNTTVFTITSDGNIPLFGGQLKFPATQNGSADPNTLDDYEEGTFTPVFADAQTGGNESGTVLEGYYTKVGRLVHGYIRAIDINTTGLTAGNSVFITGLPFAAWGSARQIFGPIYTDSTTYDSTSIYMRLEAGATYFKLVHGGAGAQADVVVSDFTDDTSDIYINYMYMAS